MSSNSFYNKSNDNEIKNTSSSTKSFDSTNKSNEEEYQISRCSSMVSVTDPDSLFQDISKFSSFSHSIASSDDSDTEIKSKDIKKIKLGICAMFSKTNSKPMKEIICRLSKYSLIEIVVFVEDVILNSPIENWPIVDCLISFFSKGFPLHKAIEYAKLRQPHLINDLESQTFLQDRRIVYSMLIKGGVDVPRYAVLNRENSQCPNIPINEEADNYFDQIEQEDSIDVNGQTFVKPFVEKPVSAEDHNICIFYPMSAGGGCQFLFRKVGSRSSYYSTSGMIRRHGSYIYEDFLPTDGTDVKVYTVGPEYAHAEARKSPALDGKVERDADGKEIRYPVILTAQEKEIANKVCKIFKQNVCGFDLLRANGKSYVCDVNGFSFVKKSKKYYDDCAQLLVDIVLRQCAQKICQTGLSGFSKLSNLFNCSSEISDISDKDKKPVNQSMLELRCVLGIIRHGDRTPKQKMKMVLTHKLFFDLFESFSNGKEASIKLKSPRQLQSVLNTTRTLLDLIGSRENNETEHLLSNHDIITENPNKLLQMKAVLEMHGHFSGINRKVQIKSLIDKRNEKFFRGRNKRSGNDLQNNVGSDIKHQLNQRPSLLLILKWGGELTEMGKKQAEELGKAFRGIYPGVGQNDCLALRSLTRSGQSCGLLRLHSTYRHDLKIYASDEGRVQMTAAAFAKGFLALEGELTPILVHLVKCDIDATSMLDASTESEYELEVVKSKLHNILQIDKNLYDNCINDLVPTKSLSVLNAIKTVGNPVIACQELYILVCRLTAHLHVLSSDDNNDKKTYYHGENIRLMERRWAKLEKDFASSDGHFDISLIPDIYDCAKYDFLHNECLHLDGLEELFIKSKALADIVVPQEYGITAEEKFSIGRGISRRLLSKIRSDLKYTADTNDSVSHRLDPTHAHDIFTPNRHVRTRLYFTSESHIHSVLNVFRYGGLFDNSNDFYSKKLSNIISSVPELNYLTQILIMQYEDPLADPDSENRFHVELYFSPGNRGLVLYEKPSTTTIASDSFQRCNTSVKLNEKVSKKTFGLKDSVLTIPPFNQRVSRFKSVLSPSEHITVINSELPDHLSASNPFLFHATGSTIVQCKSENDETNLPLLKTSADSDGNYELIKQNKRPSVNRLRLPFTSLSRNGVYSTIESVYPLIPIHGFITHKKIDNFFENICS